jgi:heptosyltransferase-2
MNGQPLSSNPDLRRILVRGVNWLGDAVMTTPALLRLREKFPDAHIALLTPEKLRELWQRHPAVDEIVSFRSKENIFSVAKKLRVGKFDLGIVLPNSHRSAIEVWLAGIPCRLGYARPGRNFFLTASAGMRPRRDASQMRKRTVAEIRELIAGAHRSEVTYRATDHQIYDYLQLVATLGASAAPHSPQLFVTQDEVNLAMDKFDLRGVAPPIFGLNAGAEYGPAKRWPVEKFIAAAQAIQKRTNCAWLIFGGKNDAPMAGQIESAIRHSSFVIRNVCGQTSLRELMALLKMCRVLLTNDTGPMHVAAALGTPVVVPFGSTSPELTGPGLPGDPRHRLLKSDAPCSPCFLRECPIDFRCMNGIGVERVVAAVLELAPARSS